MLTAVDKCSVSQTRPREASHTIEELEAAVGKLFKLLLS